MLPRFALIEQKLPDLTVADIPGTVEEEMDGRGLARLIAPGMKVAITAGSRGIHRIGPILRVVADRVKAAGGRPYIVPAMGSHGGATASGQVETLRELGISASSVGAPVLSSLEVDELGQTDRGMPVYLDRFAAQAGGIIVVARVKPHTDYRGNLESGLHKMLAIGLGKHRQAQAIHRWGTMGLKEAIPEVARAVLKKAPILMGLAILENGYDETAKIVALKPEEFAAREPELLEEARRLRPRLPFAETDILLVGEMGKEISGTGMDTGIIGRIGIYGEEDPPEPRIRYLAVLNLTPASHGNALGIGLADFTTVRLMKSIDYEAMRENIITSTFIQRGKIPLAFPSDREALEAALRCFWLSAGRRPEVAFIKNTKDLARILVSENLLDRVKGEGIRLIKKLALPFDQEANIPLAGLFEEET